MSSTIVVGTFRYTSFDDDTETEVFGPFEDTDAAETWINSVEPLFNAGSVDIEDKSVDVVAWLITVLADPKGLLQAAVETGMVPESEKTKS